jgi:tetratricopeptide (TPR) repeat protein
LWRRVTAVVVVGAMALGAGLIVANAAGSRKPGGTATGTIGNRNFEALLDDAAASAQKGDFTGALRDYDTVLKQDPTNVEALAEKGLLLASLAGPANQPQYVDRGEELVRQAIAADGSAARAYFYLGLVLRLRNDTAGALAAFDAALARNPSANLKPQIQQYRDQTAAGK